MIRVLGPKWLVLLLFLSKVSSGQDKAYPVLLDDGPIYLEENIVIDNKGKLASDIINGQVYRLIQFNTTPSLSVHEQLTSLGISLDEYIPKNAFVARIPAHLLPEQLIDLGVRSSIELPISMKFLSRIKNEYTLPADNKKGVASVVIKIHSGIDLAVAMAKISTLINVELIVSHSNLIYGTVKNRDFNKLSNNKYVRYIDLAPEPGLPEHDFGRTLHRVNRLQQSSIGRSYDGTGVGICVNDDGYVGPHIDFQGRTEQSDVATDFTGTHGDMVAGILGGAGNLDPTMRGMAPGSFIHVRQYDGTLPNTVTLHQNDQVMIFNSSYGNGCNAGYTALTEQVDNEVFNNPSLIQVFSCGNSGGSDCGYGAGGSFGNITGGHKIGKNVIATANLNESDNLESSSSRGPSADGRLKPDLAANGIGQLSTDPNNVYSPGGGTSAASPGIAGVTALLYQAYRELNGGNNPNSGLIKACMLNTAEDLGNPGPDYSFGWGRVNADKAVTVLEQGNFILDSVIHGDVNTHVLSVPAGVEEIRVMLYWMENAASPSSSVVLINDLDMTVEDPGAAIYLPLVLDPTSNVASLSANAAPGRDSLNNMEQVRIVSGSAGNYMVHVSGFSVPFGSQKYYLTWEFVQDEIIVTYPSGGESLIAGEQDFIRWDAHDVSGDFSIEVSIDNGATYSLLSSTVPGSIRTYQWTVPNGLSERALIRVSRGSLLATSISNFVISETPQNIILDWVCADSLKLSWTAIAGVSEYEVSQLGVEYMDSITRTSVNSAVIHGHVFSEEDWFSVKAILPNGGEGQRANAIQKVPGIFNCALQYNIEVSSIESPMQGTVFDCHDVGNTPVIIKVSNVGLDAVADVPVSFQLNGGAIVSEIIMDSLQPGTDTVFVFTTNANLSAVGMHNLIAWTGHPLDQFFGDDTLAVNTAVDAGSTISGAWMQDFDDFTACGSLNDCGVTICSLGSDWKNENNSTVDDIDWRTDNNGTPSGSTGPDFDHTLGNSLGNYLFTEASGGCSNQVATLLSPCIDLNSVGPSYLSFWFHMSGADMGSLHVDVFDGVQYDLDVWTISGDQGDSWRHTLLDLANYQGQVINIRFRGVTGMDYQSDIALDDIGLESAFNIPVNNLISFQIFPNPVDEKLLVSFAGIDNKEALLTIYDVLGKRVLTEKLSPLTNTHEINSTNFPEGSYVVAITSQQQMLAIEQFIIMH
jgi:hypothetical protein